MPLIEGVGDEVTLVFSLLLIGLVIICAWLSTHTRDISFFSVLVVELRQRRRLRNQSSEQTSENSNVAGAPDSQPTEDSHGNAGASNMGSGLTSDVADTQNGATPGDVDNVREITPNENSDSNVESENTDSSALDPEDETDLTASRLQETHHLHDDPHSDSREAQEEDVVLDSSGQIQTEAILDSHLDGHTLRRRRLDFFSKLSKSDAASGTQFHNNETKNKEVRDVNDSDSVVHSTCERVKNDTTEVTQGSVNDAGSSSQTDSQTDTSQAFISPPQSGDTGSSEREIELESGNIRVKLKYLNDTQRLVQASPVETIGNFKRAHFASELADNKLVRLIFNGQDLRNDTSTLQAYNIQDNCTVHCLITQVQQQQSAEHSDGRNTDMDISMLMFPLFGLFLATVWYFRFTYRQYFNTMSTVSLFGITFLFCIAFFSTWRAQRENHRHID